MYAQISLIRAAMSIPLASCEPSRAGRFLCFMTLIVTHQQRYFHRIVAVVSILPRHRYSNAPVAPAGRAP
jgi:hypothetical protein